MSGPATKKENPKSAARTFLQRWHRIGRSDRVLLCEAMVLLAVARIAIAVLPFRAVGWIAGRGCKTVTPNNATSAAVIGRVRWAVLACARRAPFRAVCFQQGVAAQIMLRRRGVPSILYFGAVPDEQRGLVAHVWVQVGDEDVVGGKNASRFAVLAKFPAGAIAPSTTESLP